MKAFIYLSVALCTASFTWASIVSAQPTSKGAESRDSDLESTPEPEQPDATSYGSTADSPDGFDGSASHTGEEEKDPNELASSRSNRMVAVVGSLGWNSLAGFGIGATLNFGPHIAADVSIGLAAIGLKSGARVRYNLVESNWTPSLGMGFQYGPGSGGEVIAVDGQDGFAELVVEPSGYLQGLVAMSYQGQGGFTALFGVGYSVLMDNDNIRLVSGSEETADITRLVVQDGVVLEVALGYAF